MKVNVAKSEMSLQFGYLKKEKERNYGWYAGFGREMLLFDYTLKTLGRGILPG